MRIAIVTCENPIERDDDLDFLGPALIRKGAEVDSPGWSDPRIDWGAFDVALLSSTWDYHERLKDFSAWLRATARVTRLQNSLELVEWNLDKGYLCELEAAGVPTIPTVWIDRGTAAAATGASEIAGHEWEQVVIKPVVDLGARNLVRVPAELAGQMLERYEVATMAQPYLPSVVTDGELSLVYIDGELSHSLRKLPARGDFRVQPQYGGTHEATDVDDVAIAIGERALAACPGKPLYARVDLVRLGDGSHALIELELIEPALYLDVEPASAPRLASAVLAAAA